MGRVPLLRPSGVGSTQRQACLAISKTLTRDPLALSHSASVATLRSQDFIGTQVARSSTSRCTRTRENCYRPALTKADPPRLQDSSPLTPSPAQRRLPSPGPRIFILR